MLIASTGLSVNYHYCENELADWSFMERELECSHHKKEKIESCCSSSQINELQDLEDIHFNESDCCKTSKAKVNMEPEFRLDIKNIESFYPIILFHPLLIESIIDKEKNIFNIKYADSPPQITQHSFLCIQSFLL